MNFRLRSPYFSFISKSPYRVYCKLGLEREEGSVCSDLLDPDFSCLSDIRDVADTDAELQFKSLW